MITSEDGHDVFRSRGVELHHCDHQTLAAVMVTMGRRVDAVVVDAPYSERCHAGHDTQTASVNEANASERSSLNYAPWGQPEVSSFCAHWSPLVADWIVSLTDSDLSPVWRAQFEAFGLLAFARVPSIETGATVRFNGDGPPNWTVDVMPARTRHPRHQGAWKPAPYYLGPRETKPVVGGKPLRLMRAIVSDYSCPGGLVCDPCAGGGTTLLAAVMEGRQAIGSEPMREHFDIACRRLSEMPLDNPRTGQAALFR